MSEIQNTNPSVNATTDAVVRADGNFVGRVDLGTFCGRGAGRPARRPQIPIGYQSQFEEMSTAGRDVVSDPTSEHLHRHVLPAMSAQCTACGSRVWPWEKRRRNADSTYVYSICCGYGVVDLPPVLRPSEPLYALLTRTNQESSRFRDQIRLYNGVFAFASLGVDHIDENYTNSRGGAYCFRIQGSVYHQIAPLESQAGRPPCFAQIYIYDSEEQLAIRQSVFPNARLIDTVLLNIQEMLEQHNPHVQTFQTAANRLCKTPNINLNIHNPGEEATHCDVVLFRHGRRMERINETSSLYDPLHYVLMFPNGETGWSKGIPLRGQQSLVREPDQQRHGRQHIVSVRQFYAHRIQERNQALLHLYVWLWHQYVVDMYAKIEHRHMHYYRSNQRKLRVERYSGMADTLQQDVRENNDELARTLGRRVISSFFSHWQPPYKKSENISVDCEAYFNFFHKKRYMQQLYQDAMAIVRHYRKPDLFITIIYNPEWPEIREALASNGQQAGDRPDLVTRVFSEKGKAIMTDLKDNNVLGKVLAWVMVIEFQKHGLPHAHIVLILDENSKIRIAEDVDNIVSAEIPDSQRYPQAYATVTRNMIHTPCGVRLNNQAARCMTNGACSKKYRKPFANETRFDENGNITYRRRNMPDRTIDTTINRANYQIGNQWVVPYNLYLTTKYNSHINVEICASNKAVKYLYKYIYKGSDRAHVTIGTTQNATTQINNTAQNARDKDNIESQDEIESFLNVRYVSAAESCWRIFQKDMQDHFPSVKRLDIHLPLEEPIYFDADANVKDLQRSARNRRSTLTDWFALNQCDHEARQYLYSDIHSEYVYNRQRGWYCRSRSHNRGVAPISRMYFVQPRDLEKYSLRLLLLHVPGAISFEDLRTYQDVEYPDFKASAVEITTSASRLHDLFGVILAFCNILSLRHLWDTYRDDIAADFLENRRRQLQLESGQQHVELLEEDIAAAHLRALEELASLLPQYRRSLAEFTDMPQLPLQEQGTRQHTYDRLLEEETRHNRVQLGNNPRCINPCTREWSIFFLDGPGGTGKTFVYNALLANVRSNGGISIPVASSGIAATLLRGGRTSDSRFGLPLDLNADTICNIRINSAQAQILSEPKLIIWDEAPMCHKFAFEAVDRLLRKIMSINDQQLLHVPFGGKPVVIGVDFRQTLPIVTKGTKADFLNASLTNSYLFQNNIVHQLRLIQNMRVQQSSDPAVATQLQQFAEYLLRIGEAREPGITIPDSDAVTIDLPHESCITSSSLTSVVRAAYPNLEENYNNRDYMTDCAILAPYNDDVNELNNAAHSIFPGESYEYLSSDTIADSEAFAATHPPKYLNMISLSNYPPHQLSLKLHQPIMLLRNINPQKGLCNGTRLICRNFLPHVIEAEISQGDFAGEIVYIPRITLYFKDNDLPFKLCRCQFPIVPAFAMTINKSQGQTLNRTILCLYKPVFAHGQLYVALS
ncbi:hypothetical protein INT45_001288 [Circinella minor]|uniref:ATP-dependent DNA helicase n=1 Tax=Circinella minor TaxID=1195481 RepID=A0A8H7RNK6_9FUNG|nr:hypothetical protein INT45_001288 [Circinella minor]